MGEHNERHPNRVDGAKGFGALDTDETLDQVIQALEALQTNHRFLCVMTHLTQFAERMPAHIRVKKAPEGRWIELERYLVSRQLREGRWRADRERPAPDTARSTRTMTAVMLAARLEKKDALVHVPPIRSNTDEGLAIPCSRRLCGSRVVKGFA